MPSRKPAPKPPRPIKAVAPKPFKPGGRKGKPKITETMGSR